MIQQDQSRFDTRRLWKFAKNLILAGSLIADECWQSLSRVQDQRPSMLSSLTGRTCFLLHFPALRTGLLSSGPPGLIFSDRQRTCAILIATS
jgi:hypothetical protein